MKKFSLILLMALLTLSYSKAQEVNFGAKAGVNFADIKGKDVSSFDGRTCFHAGIMVEIMLSEKFAFQPELLYSCQGSDYSETYDIGTDTFVKAGLTYSGTVKADFLNMPLMAKYFITEGFSLEVGPQIGLLLSAKDAYDLAGDSGEEDIKEYLKGIDFGVNFGLGYKLENGLNVAVRYNLGLTDLNDDPDYLGDSDYKNGVFQISLGFFF